MAPAIVVVDVESGASRVVRDAGVVLLEGLVAAPEALAFPSGPDPSADDAPRAHAWWYPPRNPEASVPEDERPPVIVAIHGGPTGAAVAAPRPDVLYWTSRGFGVVDVDYRGSTGHGRGYREALYGRWGVADVEDCAAAVVFLAARGDVDPARAVIRGGSAGGYTTLMALCTTDAFAAGTSLYGVADVAALAAETHSFESRYMDALMGAPHEEAPDLWRARSPLGNLDGLTTPTLVLQGLEDAVVPPSQAEQIVAALRERGVTHAYLAFEGEQHGFRQASTIIRALEAELAFYGHVLGFAPADESAVLPELVGPATPQGGGRRDRE
jgi:dipeptidyl aminopeptidase/acylaminoacyl peptidase